MKNYDFGGWATKNDLRCSDGRIIRKDAFKGNDGRTVPLVWNHEHNDPMNVLGHAVLENRDSGVYAYCYLNSTPAGENARELVKHGDVKALSIYANKLQHKGSDVLHGEIREVSVVLAGANPGAFIDSVIMHGEDEDEVALLFTGEEVEICHAEEVEKETEELQHAEDKEDKGEEQMADKDKTVQEVFDELTEEQKTVVYAMIGMALEDAGKGETEDMKHNVFDNDEMEYGNTLSHADMESIIADAKRYGSLKDSFLAHAETGGYGIEDIDVLFPDAKSLNTPPDFISREMGWVQKVMSKTHHTPFSRIKSMFADITEDQARAKGYIKGKLKKEEVFSLLKRTTTPTTIYKKQKLDRDDTVDITDFDVIAWIKAEMRVMLDEEIARAILIGDGRLSSDDDHINADNIRPVLNDADLFTVRGGVATGATSDVLAKNFINACIKMRKHYKGTGKPDLYTTEDMLTEMLLLEDGIGHKLYKSESELATALRVGEIITVPVMEGLKDKDNKSVYGIIVNLADYNVGADKGGAVNLFDDFDIDYNAMKYLIETRCSGALVKPFSAIVLRQTSESTNADEFGDLVEILDEFRKTKHEQEDPN